MKKLSFAAAAAAALVPAIAIAGPKTVSGTANGMSWTASSNIVGQTSTATVAGGGNPIYLAPNATGYSGVVGLLMRYDNNQAFVCSGSLTYNHSIVTAAHCVSNGAANDVNGRAAGLVSTTAFFYDQAASLTDNPIYAGGPGVTQIDVSDYFVHSDYTGEVVDQNDIAVLRLSEAAPVFAQAYGIYTGGDLTGEEFNVAGFGLRSDSGGDVGTNLGVGRRRQGNNIYDYALGDDAFGDFFTGLNYNGGTERFFGTAEVEYSFISDFDRLVTGDNNQACFVAQAVSGMAVPQFCSQAVGPHEVSIAGGDSGGPGFINGRIASVNSYSLSFGSGFGDLDDNLNDSFGELNGFVPTYIHSRFIAQAIPEPSTWALLILGFGVVGGAMRRKNKLQPRYAF